MKKFDMNSLFSLPPEHRSRIDDLTELLGDSDECVASLAMEQMLDSSLWQNAVRQNIDCGDAVMRRRLHQLNNIGERRKQKDLFVTLLKAEKLELWAGLLLLDQIYDNQSAASYLEELAGNLVNKFRTSGQECSFEGLISFMKTENFTCITKNWMDLSNYILGDVLESHCGSGIIICGITQYVARQVGLPVQIFLHCGYYCLCYERKIMVAPVEGWSIERKIQFEQYHQCQDHELLQILLQQLFAMSVIEWNSWDVNFFSTLIEKVHNIHRDKMPYPLGRMHLQKK